MMMKAFLGVLLSAAVAGNLLAADWYVSIENGKKKNTGAIDAPLKNIWAAIEKAQPGDVIHIAEGNYPGKTSCGWIEVDKSLTLLGGYSSDFSERDVLKHLTMLRPTNEMNATKPPMPKGTLTVTTKGSDARVVIDGIIVDQGDANSYHAVNGKPEGVETGMWLEPPAKGNTKFPSINTYSFAADTDGFLEVRNCVFINGSNYAMNINHFAGDVKIINNVFVNNRMMAANISCKKNEPLAVELEFAYNTVLFTWSRTKELSDMGFGLRANTRVEADIHNNIFGFSVGSGFDNTMGDPKTKEISLDDNMFFLNKSADVTITISPNIKYMKVTDDSFEDLEDTDGMDSVEDNISISDPAVFADILDPAYVQGFLAASYSETTDYDPNSPENTFRAAFGMNQRGSIKSQVSMFANRYPFDNVMKLFGAIKNYGAQLPGSND